MREYTKGFCTNRVELLVFALLAASRVASAQTVDDIIARSIEAKGGRAKVAAIQTLRMTANFATFNLAVGDMQAKFTQVQKRPGKVRLDWSFSAPARFTLIQAYDGESAWHIVSTRKKKRKDQDPMTARDLHVLQEQADIDGPLVDYKQKGNKVEVVGKEIVEGRDAYCLRVTLKNGEVSNFYLDADNFLHIKSSGRATLQGIEVSVQKTFGDYKEVQGVMFPFSIEEHTRPVLGGQEAGSKITLIRIEVNVPLDDSIFSMPRP
jgi:hypothetical protein